MKRLSIDRLLVCRRSHERHITGEFLAVGSKSSDVFDVICCLATFNLFEFGQDDAGWPVF